MHYKIPLFFVVALLSGGLAGCSTGDGRVQIVSVSGTVMLDGKPLQDGVVEFMDRSTGYAAGAPLDADGNFQVEHIAVGSYEVVIRPPYLPPPGEPIVPRPSTMGPIRPIPRSYQDSKTSGFTLEVGPDGADSVLFTLASKS